MIDENGLIVPDPDDSTDNLSAPPVGVGDKDFKLLGDDEAGSSETKSETEIETKSETEEEKQERLTGEYQALIEEAHLSLEGNNISDIPLNHKYWGLVNAARQFHHKHLGTK